MLARFPLLLLLVLPLAACSEDDPAAPADTGGGDLYEIKHEVMTAAGWFGGDDRPGFTPRSVGNGCSVTVDANIVLENFSLHFERAFYLGNDLNDTGYAVTLVLNVRDAAGAILKTVQVDLPGSYTGGWVTWTGIDLNVSAGTTLNFTSYLVGALSATPVTNGATSDLNATFAGGVRYTKESDDSDADMEPWAGWIQHPWDPVFRLQGTTR